MICPTFQPVVRDCYNKIIWWMDTSLDTRWRRHRKHVENLWFPSDFFDLVRFQHKFWCQSFGVNDVIKVEMNYPLVMSK